MAADNIVRPTPLTEAEFVHVTQREAFQRFGHAGQARVIVALAAARAPLDDVCDNDAGRSCLELWPSDLGSWCEGCQGKAINALAASRAQPETATPREEALSELVWWMLGERDNLPPMPEHVSGKPRRNYWWRHELRARFEAVYANYPCSVVVVAPSASRAPAPPAAVTWQPIATAPKDNDTVYFWWIVPKTAEESYVTASGNPITSNHKGYRHYGKRHTWGALSKPTHWMPDFPAPSLDRTPETRESVTVRFDGSILAVIGRGIRVEVDGDDEGEAIACVMVDGEVRGTEILRKASPDAVVPACGSRTAPCNGTGEVMSNTGEQFIIHQNADRDDVYPCPCAFCQNEDPIEAVFSMAARLQRLCARGKTYNFDNHYDEADALIYAKQIAAARIALDRRAVAAEADIREDAEENMKMNQQQLKDRS